MVVVTCFGPQALEHRRLAWLASPRPALQAIIDSKQSAHAGIPTVPEERAMPVVAYSLAPPPMSFLSGARTHLPPIRIGGVAGTGTGISPEAD